MARTAVVGALDEDGGAPLAATFRNVCRRAVHVHSKDALTQGRACGIASNDGTKLATRDRMWSNREAWVGAKPISAAVSKDDVFGAPHGNVYYFGCATA